MLQFDARHSKGGIRINIWYGFDLQHARQCAWPAFFKFRKWNNRWHRYNRHHHTLRTERDIKRRKVNEYRQNQTVHLSQVQHCWSWGCVKSFNQWPILRVTLAPSNNESRKKKVKHLKREGQKETWEMGASPRDKYEKMFNSPITSLLCYVSPSRNGQSTPSLR